MLSPLPAGDGIGSESAASFVSHHIDPSRDKTGADRNRRHDAEVVRATMGSETFESVQGPKTLTGVVESHELPFDHGPGAIKALEAGFEIGVVGKG